MLVLVLRFALGGLWAILCAVVQGVRETLPETERDAQSWLAGALWAFVAHWTMLIAVTYAFCQSRGGC